MLNVDLLHKNIFLGSKRHSYLFSFIAPDTDPVSDIGVCWKTLPNNISIFFGEESIVAITFFRWGKIETWLWLRSWNDLLMALGLSSQEVFSFFSLEQPGSGWKSESSEQDSLFRISASTDKGRTASLLIVQPARLPVLIARPILNPLTDSAWRFRLLKEALSARN